MYEYIKGIIEDIGTDYIVLEAGGIGYFITATGGTINMCRGGESVKIYIYQSVKEDNISLYGFASAEEKRMFLRLVSVSGIGPRIAVQTLTAVSVQELAIALVTGDTAALTRVPGIGKKTAQRMILELREQVDNDELPSGDFKAAAAADERCISEAVGALTALGIPQAEAVRAVKEAASKADTAEEIIRIVLKGIDKF